MEIKDIAGIGFSSGGPLEDKANLPVSDRVFRQIVIDNQSVHAVIHEPLAHRGAGEWREILIRGRVRRRRGDDRRIGHRAFLFQNGERTRDVGVLLPYRNVDAIERPIIFQVAFFRRLIQPRLADDRVDRDR